MDRGVLFNDSKVESSHSSQLLGDKFKEHKRVEAEKSEAQNSFTIASYGKEFTDESSDKISDEVHEEDDEEEESAIEDGLIEAQVEDILGEFQGYSNDNVSLFYSVFFVALLWVFYEETVVAKEYGIKQSDFIFYLYF